MGSATKFRKERYSDLWPILEKAMGLTPGKSITMECPEKSPHTVGQKCREFFRLAAQDRPDLGIEDGDFAVSVFPESRRVVIKRKEGIKYGAVLVEED